MFEISVVCKPVVLVNPDTPYSKVLTLPLNSAILVVCSAFILTTLVILCS
jgi:hypothetical protein